MQRCTEQLTISGLTKRLMASYVCEGGINHVDGKNLPSKRAIAGITIDLLRLHEDEIASIGIGRKFQKPTVFEQLSVFENLELALQADRGVRSSMFFRLSGEQLDRIGANYCVGQFMFGDMSSTEAHHSIDLFTSHVMPAIAGALSPA